MALYYGFYDSVNGDKTYSAADFSKIFDGIIGDGVIAGYGNALGVRAAETSMGIYVGAGRAWFNHTWTHNDADMHISNINKPTSGYKRIDTVVVEVNPINRVNAIKVIKGTQVASGSTPSSPTLSQGTSGNYQYPLADIHLNGSMTAITGDCVVDRRSFAPILSVEVNNLFKQYESSFNAWFNRIKDVLDDDAAANLTEWVQTFNDNLDCAYQHRNVFRGRNLGSTITTAQKNAIKNGTFADIYVGDYWTFGGVNWRVVDIDYWYRGRGSGATLYHHVIVMPDEPTLTSVRMRSTATTSGGFANSELGSYCIFSDQSELDQMKTEPYVPSEIAKQLLTVREFLVDEVDEDDGRPTGAAWYDTMCTIPSEIMMYGTRIWSYGNNGSGTRPADGSSINPLFTSSPTQLALFRLCPKFIFSSKTCWLRDAVSGSQYASVLGYSNGNGGNANRAVASSDNNARLIFAIGGL